MYVYLDIHNQKEPNSTLRLEKGTHHDKHTSICWETTRIYGQHYLEHHLSRNCAVEVLFPPPVLMQHKMLMVMLDNSRTWHHRTEPVSRRKSKLLHRRPFNVEWTINILNTSTIDPWKLLTWTNAVRYCDFEKMIEERELDTNLTGAVLAFQLVNVQPRSRVGSTRRWMNFHGTTKSSKWFIELPRTMNKVRSIDRTFAGG